MRNTSLRIVGGDGLVTAYNDEPNWLKAHQLLMPAFSQAAMRRCRGARPGPVRPRPVPSGTGPGAPAGLYKPFGTGERSCIGRQFALHEAVLLLGVVLRRYDLIADPGYQHADPRLTMMPRDFRLGLLRR